MNISTIYQRLSRLQMRTRFLRSKDDGHVWDIAKEMFNNKKHFYWKYMEDKKAITPLI